MADTINRNTAIFCLLDERVENGNIYTHKEYEHFLNDPEAVAFGDWRWRQGYNDALNKSEILLEKIPSSNPEQIACRDCKHYCVDTSNRVWIEDSFKAGAHCVIMCRRMMPNDFCSYACRRNDG